MVEFSDGNPNENLREIRTPLQDRLIKDVLELYLQLGEVDEIEQKRLRHTLLQALVKLYQKPNDKNVFLPTFCYRTLEHIASAYPVHHVIMSDFDMLRASESVSAGVNAPIVSQKLEKAHEKRDYKDYLVPRGAADIFFPTDFRLLQKMYKKATRGKYKGDIYKTYEFMKQFSRDQWTETSSGYNPLKEDFMNTSFFVTRSDVELK